MIPISVSVTIPPVTLSISSTTNSQPVNSEISEDESIPKSDVITTSNSLIPPSSNNTPQPEDILDVNKLLESGVTVWSNSALALAVGCIGWWREADAWVQTTGYSQIQGGRTRGRPAYVTRASTDFKYRSRLCTHWELSGGTTCPMRKKGKCDFAHGPLELRVKEGRRDRWGQKQSSYTLDSNNNIIESLHISGGEDVLCAARSIEKVRAAEGSVSEFEKSTNKKGSNTPIRNTNTSNNRFSGTPNKKINTK